MLTIILNGYDDDNNNAVDINQSRLVKLLLIIMIKIMIREVE